MANRKYTHKRGLGDDQTPYDPNVQVPAAITPAVQKTESPNLAGFGGLGNIALWGFAIFGAYSFMKSRF